LYYKFEYKVCRVGLNFIFQEAVCSKKTGMDKKKCGCVIKTSYQFRCACILAMRTHNKKPIRLD